jgi:hypothetical protein
MNKPSNGTTARARRRLSNLLAAFGGTALELAASPAAFAFDRGGPGAPHAQRSASAFFPVSKLPQRYVS